MKNSFGRFLATVLITTSISATAQMFPPLPPGFPTDPGLPEGPGDPPPPLNTAPYAVATVDLLPSGEVRLNASESFDPEGDALSFAWSIDGVPVGTTAVMTTWVAPGQHLVRIDVADPSGLGDYQTFDLTVEGDFTPPELTVDLVSPAVLWPPNGKLTSVQLAITATDNLDPEPTVRIASVECNQPLVPGEVILEGDWGLSVAATRLPQMGSRIYTVIIEALDDYGNKTEKTVQIIVPKNQRSK